MDFAFAPLVLLAGLCAGAQASPLDDLLARKAGNSACFTRVYDAEHLRKNPKQAITSMAVRFSYDKELGNPPSLVLGLGLAIRRKADPQPLFAQGVAVGTNASTWTRPTGG
jgi:hypothetical protein